MASYPDAVYSPRAKENRSGVVYDADKKSVIFVQDVSKLDDEVVAVETELGTSPKGDYSDVKERIENTELNAIIFTFDGAGAEITTGLKQFLLMPFKCEIQQVTLLADVSGNIVIDIWKDSYANFPPTDADSITSATPPTISAAQKSQDSTLTNWTKTINAGDVLAFNVDSAATITNVILILKIKKIK